MESPAPYSGPVRFAPAPAGLHLEAAWSAKAGRP